MKTDIWMPLYVGDYLKDTMHLDAEGHGAYILLIIAYWNNGGPIPMDDDWLRTVSRVRETSWMRVKGMVLPFFQVEGDKLRQKRVDEEIANAIEKQKSLSDRGRRGAEERWNAQAMLRQCSSNAQGMLADAPTPSQSPSVQEGGVPRAEDCQELPTVEEAIAQTMTAGIPEDFSRHVYEDWSSRAGKDAGGVLVRFLPYVTKRWAREQVEWRSGQHKGKKASGKPSGARLGPSLKEVQTYASDKWGEDDRHHTWAVSFHRFWNDKGWKRQGKLIDWQSELTKQVAGWRA